MPNSRLFKFCLGLIVIMFLSRVSFGEEARKDDDGLSRNLYSRLQDEGFTGFLRTDYFSSDKASSEKTDFLGLTAQIKILPRLSDKIDSRFEARAYNFDILHYNNDNSASELLEGLAIFRFENSDLSVGKQIITWGRADGVNPTDNLSPKNYTLLLPEEGDRKTGVASLKYDYYFSPELTATLFYSPFF